MGLGPLNDYIGFNPTQNQAEYGAPQVSPYGIEARGMEAHGILDYFPSWPYRGLVDYTGAQAVATPTTDSIFVRTHLYRGIAPLDLQPLIDAPYPYRMGLNDSWSY